MLRGLPTLKMFGRGPEQVANIRAISRRYGDTTMDVLRTAFQTSLVLEWGAAVARGAGRGRGEPAADGRLDRVRTGAGGPDHRSRVLPATTDARDRAITRARKGGRSPSGSSPCSTSPCRTGVRRGRGGPAGTAVPAAVDIVFAGVTVTYPGRTAPALDGFDLVIPERGVVALVGATGAGKTTAANLLLRFIEPDAGSIRVGGVPLASIDLAAWRSHVAWVPQRPYLFHGSVADNIRLARPDASADEIRAAAARGRRGDVHRRDAAWLRHAGRGGRDPAQRRAAPAHRPGPGVPHRRAPGHPRRGDLAPGRGQRRPRPRCRGAHGARPGGAGRVAPPTTRVAVADIVAVVDHGRVVQVGAPADLAARDGPFRRLLATDDADARA